MTPTSPGNCTVNAHVPNVIEFLHIADRSDSEAVVVQEPGEANVVFSEFGVGIVNSRFGGRDEIRPVSDFPPFVITPCFPEEVI